MKNAPPRSSRLNRGTMILANAQLVNTKSFKARLDAFAGIHGRYIEAHTKVEEAEALERTELQRVEQFDGEQDKAITALSAALLLDGESRRNPFPASPIAAPGRCACSGSADSPDKRAS